MFDFVYCHDDFDACCLDEVSTKDRHWFTVVLEAIVVFLLFIEVVTGMIISGFRPYFISHANKFDFFLLIASLILLIVFSLDSTGKEDGIEVIDNILLALRYIVQVGRLIFFALDA
eukprot:GABV01008261.1.p1 GENE.GABV01008261.1~~GABV01008261.1.p1  ORF type:complete len:116 (-),score=35.51 GABV01008261.1:3-350(-)